MVEKTPPKPLPSATVLLVRESTGQPEVFMVVRHHQIDFASGALVFPGGKVDAADRDDQFRQRIQNNLEDETRALQVAAIREVFEECGILLARPQGQQALIDGERLKTLDADRENIHDGRLSFIDFLARESLVLAVDQLQVFAHWITPKMMPKRFDTYFYLARAPEGQIASHDDHESVDSVWITPEQAMLDAKAGKHTLIFPTLRNLAKLARSQTLEEAVARAKTEPLVSVEPWTEKREDGTYLCIDPKAGYDLSEIKMPDRRGAKLAAKPP